jgi:hypothetical protein
MDSNFSVKVTADISALQASLKNVQADLDKFKKSADGAAAATKNMEANANRGRLVAFAFGQVLRDAGFFAQDFRLGILAISNNIPILIDQLVLLTNVSKGVGAAISLLGSLLTAGLTIWAYTAQGVDKLTSAINQYSSSVNQSRASAETEIVTLKSLLAIAGDQTKSLTQRQDAVNQLNNNYDIYNNSLTVNNVNSKKNIDTTDRLTQSILLQAKASAEAAYYTKLQAQLYDLQDAKVQDQVTILQKLGIVMKSLVVKNEDLNKSILNLDFGGFVKGYKDMFAIKGMENFADGFTKISAQLDASKKRLEGFTDSISKLGGTKKKEGPLAPLERSTLIVDERMKSVIEALNAYQSRISDIQKTPGITPFDVKKQSVEALGDLIVNLQKIDGTQDTVAKLTTKFNELNLAVTKFPFSLPLFEMVPKMIKQFTDESIAEMERLKQRVQDTFEFGIEDAISNSVMAIGDALASGDNIGKGFGGALLDSIASMAEQLGRMAIGIGIAIEGIKKALKSLNPLQAIGAGIALLALAGAARAGARSIAGGGSGSTNTAAPPSGFSFGGVNTAANTSMTNSAAMTTASQPVLETRVSGNDLVILMNRSSNARNNYY